MLPSPEMRMLGWMQRSSARQTIRRPSSCILPSLPGLRGRLPRAGRERKSASRAACLLSVMLGPESLRRVCGKGIRSTTCETDPFPGGCIFFGLGGLRQPKGDWEQGKGSYSLFRFSALCEATCPEPSQ